MIKYVLLIAVLSLATSQSFKMQPRIINGRVSETHKYPFFVQISIFAIGGVQKSMCGGTLLSDRWIVTAAHCVYESVDVLASFGIDSAGNFSTKYVQIEWENVHFHPEHVPGLNSSHDIGWCYKHMSLLIQLTNPIPLSSTIQPVKLPTDCGENISSYEDVIAAGTGLIECDHTDGILHEVDLKTFPCEECEYVNTMADLRTVIFTKQKSTKSDCSKGSPFRGDSGGPLLRSTDSSLIGILSKIVCRAGIIFNISFQTSTNLYYYFDWISEITGLELPKCDCYRN